MGENNLERLKIIEKGMHELEFRVSNLWSAQIIYRLEDLCTMLKSAILDFNLKLPPLVSFERYLRKLTNIDDVFYVMEMLHQCWVYVHPLYLFDRPTKDLMSQSEMLNWAFNRYRGKNPDRNYDFINQEVNRGNINELTLLFNKAYNHLESRQQAAYGSYMKGLEEISRSVCRSFDMELGSGFTICYVLTSKLELTRTQIDNVFAAVAKIGKMNNNEETAAAFRSLFSQTISAVEQKIQWLDVAKSHKPNYASLYVLFKTMGVEMNRFHRTIICRVFTSPQGAIDPDQLKSRETNSSDALDDFEQLVQNALTI